MKPRRATIDYILEGWKVRDGPNVIEMRLPNLNLVLFLNNKNSSFLHDGGTTWVACKWVIFLSPKNALLAMTGERFSVNLLLAVCVSAVAPDPCTRQLLDGRPIRDRPICGPIIFETMNRVVLLLVHIRDAEKSFFLFFYSLSRFSFLDLRENVLTSAIHVCRQWGGLGKGEPVPSNPGRVCSHGDHTHRTHGNPPTCS